MAIDEEAALTWLFLLLKTVAGLFVLRVILFFAGYTQHIPIVDSVLFFAIDIMKAIYNMGRAWAMRFGLA